MDVAIQQTSCLVFNSSDPFGGSEVNDDYEDNLLHCLNDEKALLYLPVIVFLGLLAIIGTLGNTLVLLVYWRKTYKV